MHHDFSKHNSKQNGGEPKEYFQDTPCIWGIPCCYECKVVPDQWNGAFLHRVCNRVLSIDQKVTESHKVGYEKPKVRMLKMVLKILLGHEVGPDRHGIHLILFFFLLLLPLQVLLCDGKYPFFYISNFLLEFFGVIFIVFFLI